MGIAAHRPPFVRSTTYRTRPRRGRRPEPRPYPAQPTCLPVEWSPPPRVTIPARCPANATNQPSSARATCQCSAWRAHSTCRTSAFPPHADRPVHSPAAADDSSTRYGLPDRHATPPLPRCRCRHAKTLYPSQAPRHPKLRLPFASRTDVTRLNCPPDSSPLAPLRLSGSTRPTDLCPSRPHDCPSRLRFCTSRPTVPSNPSCPAHHDYPARSPCRHAMSTSRPHTPNPP